MRVVGRLDPCLGWDGEVLVTEDDPRLAPGATAPPRLLGVAGSVVGGADGSWRATRDALGLAKLFWAPDGDDVVLSARPCHLVDAGFAFDDLRAVPRGTAVDGDGTERRLGPPLAGDRGVSPTDAARTIRAQIDRFLATLRQVRPDAPAFLCLSGGVDSAVVATLVRAHFPEVRAVSFDLAGTAGPSTDREVARRFAGDLGVDLVEADATADEVLDHLDVVLAEGIDWRPFNVHAGLVNAVIGQAVRDAAPDGSSPLVFTGDLANELLVDYSPEVVDGVVHYPLPDVEPAALQAALVRGLDAGSREVGVLGAWGLVPVPPYAVAADAYLRLEPEVLGDPDRKGRLADLLLDEPLPRYVRDRPKVRAQVGSDGGGGVLGACLERGVDEAMLQDRFAARHRTDAAGLRRFLTRAGTTRSAVPGSGS
jgi:asparagine synthetase B (glutamine-hydrolysing)